jgi:hypothetical protein
MKMTTPDYIQNDETKVDNGHACGQFLAGFLIYPYRNHERNHEPSRSFVHYKILLQALPGLKKTLKNSEKC